MRPTLDEVVAAYLQADEQGRSLNDDEWLARYPHVAAELAEFFAARQRVGNWPLSPDQSPADSIPPAVTYHAGDQPSGADDSSALRPTVNERDPVVPGSVLAGRYRVDAIKAGGMGCVYLAEDLEASQRGVALNVAIKTVMDFEPWCDSRRAKRASARYEDYTNLLTRFHREAIAWVRLRCHQNIILAMWVFEVGGKPHLVMEQADSGDLQAWIREQRLSVPLAVNFALQFCEGMKHAVRTSGIVHRDIKPSNVLIKHDRILKIADFGLSKAYDDFAGDADSGPAASGSGVHSSFGGGTLPYMPPEQFLSLASADTRSDIFSFGVMLHEMLTTQRLFGKRVSYKMARSNAELPQTHEINPDVPVDLSEVVARCVEYDPARRFQSFDEVALRLDSVNSQLPNPLPIPSDSQSIPAEKFTPSIQAEGEAFSLISLGRFAAAARRAQDGIDVDPDNHAHWVNRSKALIELGNCDEARSCCIRAVGLAPDDARSWANLGWMELKLGDPGAGLKSALKATQLDPEFADAWMCRGCCMQELSDPAEALRCLKIAADLEPHNWKAHANLGDCLGDTGRHAEALDQFRRAAEINPNAATCWAQLGWLYARELRWMEARGAVDRFLELCPDQADGWALRAWIIWSGESDRVSANAALSKAFELDPPNQRARIVRGAIEGCG